MANFFANAFGSPGSPAQIVTTSPYDQMVQGGQSGNFNDLANTNSTYLADMFSQLGTGQAPSYYQSYQNQAMPYYQNLLNQQFYGTPGNRSNNGLTGGPSAMGDAMSQASIFGLNPKATTGLVNKANLQYQNASQQLDQYFAGQGLNVINNTAQNLPGWATNQQNSLTEAFHPTTNYIPAQAATSGWAPGLISSMAQGGIFNGLSNMFSASGGGSGMTGYSGGQNAGFMAQPELSSSGGAPWSLSGGGQFAAAPMMFAG